MTDKRIRAGIFALDIHLHDDDVVVVVVVVVVLQYLSLVIYGIDTNTTLHWMMRGIFLSVIQLLGSLAGAGSVWLGSYSIPSSFHSFCRVFWTGVTHIQNAEGYDENQ